MSVRRFSLDQLPSELLGGDNRPFSVRERIEDTEHNVEDLLLCLQSLRTDDVPSISWNWDENAWHPDAPRDEHYPQYFAGETGAASATITPSGRRPCAAATPPANGTTANAICKASGGRCCCSTIACGSREKRANRRRRPAGWSTTRLRVVVGMHEGTPLREAFASARRQQDQGRRAAVDDAGAMDR